MMNKIIPIISLIVAALGAVIAAIGFTAVVIGAQAGSVGVIAVALPFVIVGAIITSLSAVFAFLFKRDKLCFISFFINLGGVALSCISIIIWFVVL